MNKKRIGILAALLAIATAAGISVSSCGNENGPTASTGSGANVRKNPQILADGCGSLVGFDACNFGEGVATVNDDGSISVTGTNSDADGVSYTFSSPIEKFDTKVDLNLTAAGGSLQYQALDVNRALQAQLNLTTKENVAQVSPTFTSGTPDDPNNNGFNVYIYDCDGNVVAGPINCQVGDHITITASSYNCYNQSLHVFWNTIRAGGQCQWIINTNGSGCTYTFTLPDGTRVEGCGIKFDERLPDGTPYVYIGTTYINATGNTGGTLTARSSAARPVSAN